MEKYREKENKPPETGLFSKICRTHFTLVAIFFLFSPFLSGTSYFADVKPVQYPLAKLKGNVAKYKGLSIEQNKTKNNAVDNVEGVLKGCCLYSHC
ncbi:hypothetical protein GWI33_021619 [Rhynchophorus ferrugineus]|uniref:Uncharacterized protein n=1 Tax=Rhynchophorus ferrugineus TaxID=354439 RepID=A0A834IR27_RHYFE|nr:hypothetical protein GWI33_021619 [Rhynchophorus ferrugineus]